MFSYKPFIVIIYPHSLFHNTKQLVVFVEPVDMQAQRQEQINWFFRWNMKINEK